MFTKVFQSIHDSSIMEEEPITRLVFYDLLAEADENGHVDMTLPALARRCNLPTDAVEKAIHALSSPDPISKSKTEDGRRIVPIENGRTWGWKLVNYAKYREKGSKQEKRSKDRERVAEKRAEERVDIDPQPNAERSRPLNGKLGIPEELKRLIPDIEKRWSERMACTKSSRRPNIRAQSRQLMLLLEVAKERGKCEAIRLLEIVTDNGYQGIKKEYLDNRPANTKRRSGRPDSVPTEVADENLALYEELVEEA